MLKITTETRELLSDTITPVAGYLRLRDRFLGCCLLESGDYRGAENSISYLCIEPVSTFRVIDEEMTLEYPDGTSRCAPVTSRGDVLNGLDEFRRLFQAEDEPGRAIFGFFSYDAVKYFETLELRATSRGTERVPTLQFSFFRYIVRFEHFHNRMTVFHNRIDESAGSLEEIVHLLERGSTLSSSFEALGQEEEGVTDPAFEEIVETAKLHIQRGDVFQIVLSRRFTQKYKGDNFLVYRALRSINPSPFLFYFDFGDFQLFGSSPEAQLVVSDGEASLFPIAGTYKRTGSEESDRLLAEELKADPKENAEHVMLVDLARNDLSRHCHSVKVQVYREVQFYSHVIHLVSKVTGILDDGRCTLEVFADTFPAGTLSGAPKYRAMEIIDVLEPHSRSIYGGAVGLFTDTGCLFAITIRSFLAHRGILHYQAGAGIVAGSDPMSEAQETRNKLRALKHAIEEAQRL